VADRLGVWAARGDVPHRRWLTGSVVRMGSRTCLVVDNGDEPVSARVVVARLTKEPLGGARDARCSSRRASQNHCAALGGERPFTGTAPGLARRMVGLWSGSRRKHRRAAV